MVLLIFQQIKVILLIVNFFEFINSYKPLVPIIVSRNDEKELKNNIVNGGLVSSKPPPFKLNKLIVPSAIILSNVLFPDDLLPVYAAVNSNLPLVSPLAIDVNWRYFLSGAICGSFSHAIAVPCR